MKTIIRKCFQENVNTLKKKKKLIRHITDDLENSSGESDEE